MKENRETAKDDKELPQTPNQRPRTQFLLFLGQWFVLMLLPCFGTSACDKVNSDALLSLALKAPLNLNWSAFTDCCLWEGISCGPGDQGHVVRLWLPRRGLTGVIHPSITSLTHLTHLNLSHNSLLGSLPDDLFSSLSSLQVIDLSFNHLIHRLPPSSNKISQLQVLNLSSNFFTGTIPSSILAPSVSIFNVSNNSFSGSIPIDNGSNHTSLIFLDLSYNKLIDTIPPGIGLCSKLQVFRAGFNSLSGSLPDEIFNLADLRQLSLPVNSLTGPINDGIMNLTNLQILEIFSNQFSGPIPSQIGSLSRLENLLLHVNNLTGPLPLSLANSTKLSALNLRVNNLTGDLSSFNFSPLQRLTTLDLGNNNFTGEFPKSLYSCKSLTAIRLAGNQLTGQISPEIVALESLAFLSVSTNNMTNATGALRILKGCKNLTTLILSNNFLFEPVPDDKSLGDLDGFQSLRVFSLGGCQFTGQVPTWLAKLKNLQALDLSFNLITGTLPGWLASLPNLFYIDLSNNLLQGGFPNDLFGMPVLTSKEASDKVDRSYLELPLFVRPNNATDQQYNQLSNLRPAIYLSNNSLNGSIPIEIGRLKFIHVLDLSHNKFSGSIPDQISNLTNLEKLDLSYNNLSGEIPVSLKGLHFLSSFSVAYNDLQGLVPSGGQFDTFTISSFEGNPDLCGPLTPKRSCHQSPPQVLEVTRRSKTQTILIALIFGIFFGIGFGIGFNMDDKKIPIIGWRRK
ncbi:Hypothetical predicted protein [Prunus dulcis]|uniref:Leucine-rich repeat-containing N-terminal plant-type domain-containing protein n=1 Tax=Prunus dulcis TaxID=3755 RepID=A0A5E4G5F7_PRUDU|nr:tyrosine-sulfated glycopeptide receptor 1-like [Prunus dulcis]VVA35045.1 Hypothetical predicted protein [Prunus dulcis]